MKKKIFVLFLSTFIILSNCVSSFANPLVLAKVAEVSLIYSIGRLAVDTVGFVGSVADIMDLGGSIYSKMTDKQKEDYENSVKFDNDKLTYSEDSYGYISSYVPKSQGNHLMLNVRKHFVPTPYHENGVTYTKETIVPIFDMYKDTVNIQGYNYDFLLHRKDYLTSSYQYYLFYKPTNAPFENLKMISGRHDKSTYMYFDLYISSLYNTNQNTYK